MRVKYFLVFKEITIQYQRQIFKTLTIKQYSTLISLTFLDRN
jgi:hypothetical protein